MGQKNFSAVNGFSSFFYRMPLTSWCNSLEAVSRRLWGRRGIKESLCWLLIWFLRHFQGHFQYKFCARFSFTTSGHWKNGNVPELLRSQKGPGKRGKIDSTSWHGLLLANGGEGTAPLCGHGPVHEHSASECCASVSVALFQDASNNWWVRSALKTQGLKNHLWHSEVCEVGPQGGKHFSLLKKCYRKGTM